MSKEKQIDEMAWDMCDIPKHPSITSCEKCNCHGKCQPMYYATRAYNTDYRKQSEGEWIRAENPPEEYRDECGELIPFLVCCQGTVYPFRAMYDGANWGDGIGVLKVTHWMPLPEPPKGD